SDDVRDSPALVVAARLAELGADVVATDPQAIATSRRLHPELVTAPTALEAADGAEAVLLLTEWQEYRQLDPEALGSVVRQRAILDGRNVLDPGLWRAAGWRYVGLG